MVSLSFNLWKKVLYDSIPFYSQHFHKITRTLFSNLHAGRKFPFILEISYWQKAPKRPQNDLETTWKRPRTQWNNYDASWRAKGQKRSNSMSCLMWWRANAQFLELKSSLNLNDFDIKTDLLIFIMISISVSQKNNAFLW